MAIVQIQLAVSRGKRGQATSAPPVCEASRPRRVPVVADVMLGVSAPQEDGLELRRVV